METELQYELSVAESYYKSVKINKIRTFDNIQQIIDELNKTSIIGEDPTKYWEKDPVICKLVIINPDLIIKTKDIQYGNFQQEKCKNHIKILLDLKVILPSPSPHRSPTLIFLLFYFTTTRCVTRTLIINISGGITTLCS